MSSFWTTYLGGEIAYVNVGGVRTRYASLGTGNPLVLLHGRGGHLETFVRNVGELSQRFRAIAFDLLGHGMTDQAPDGRYEIDRLAAHFIAFLDALSLPRAHIVGQSLGGWVATWSALQAPGRVGRLALIEPAGLMAEEERLGLADVAARYKSGGEAFENPSVAAVRKRLTGLVERPDDMDQEMVDTRWRLYQPAAARDVHLKVRHADNARFLLTHERLAQLRNPVLIIRGEHGHTPEPVMRGVVETLQHGRLLTVPGTRQWPQYERPDVVTPEIANFLAEGE